MMKKDCFVPWCAHGLWCVSALTRNGVAVRCSMLSGMLHEFESELNLS